MKMRALLVTLPKKAVDARPPAGEPTFLCPHMFAFRRIAVEMSEVIPRSSDGSSTTWEKVLQPECGGIPLADLLSQFSKAPRGQCMSSKHRDPAWHCVDSADSRGRTIDAHCVHFDL